MVDVFQSYEEDFALDFETFELSFSKNVVEHGSEGQQLWTDGNGQSSWGGVPYVLVFEDNFNGTTVDPQKWITISGTPSISGGKIDLLDESVQAIQDPFIISVQKQVKLETTMYFIQASNAAYSGVVGLVYTPDWEAGSVIIEKSSSGSSNWKLTCWKDGNHTSSTNFSIPGETDATISLIITQSKASVYVNGTLTRSITTNIPHNKSLTTWLQANNSNELLCDYVKLKVLGLDPY